MANNYSQTTYAPEIPKSLVTERLDELCEALGIEMEDHGGHFYLYAEDGGHSGYMEVECADDPEMVEEVEVLEEDLFAEIQSIIRSSEGKLTWFSAETAYTCDKMRHGEFGGAAVFVTADSIQWCSTASWLSERRSEIETGDTRD